MRRDPINIVHRISYFRYETHAAASGTNAKFLSADQIRERKKWCAERFGIPGRQATWWQGTTNTEYTMNFSRMEDVTMYLLVWGY